VCALRTSCLAQNKSSVSPFCIPLPEERRFGLGASNVNAVFCTTIFGLLSLSIPCYPLIPCISGLFNTTGRTMDDGDPLSHPAIQLQVSPPPSAAKGRSSSNSSNSSSGSGSSFSSHASTVSVWRRQQQQPRQQQLQQRVTPSPESGLGALDRTVGGGEADTTTAPTAIKTQHSSDGGQETEAEEVCTCREVENLQAKRDGHGTSCKRPRGLATRSMPGALTSTIMQILFSTFERRPS
jgi:hypothetical protein